jgi:hypothetical protein
MRAGVAQSVQCLTADWTTGRTAFDPRQRQMIFPVASVPRPALVPIEPPIQWIPPMCPFLGAKARPGRDADHSPPSAEVENE